MRYYNPVLSEAGFMDLVLELQNRYEGFVNDSAISGVPMPGISAVNRAAMLELDRAVTNYINSVNDVAQICEKSLLYPYSDNQDLDA